ncbi:MAG TPA: spore germination protein GerW family protein [Chloroflexota bacterium]|nr:spore germination protein GerW family protein [Chloroflexota bacterium]
MTERTVLDTMPAPMGLDRAREILDRIVSVAQTTAVWSVPVEKDGTMVITASEVMAGAGFGFGGGRGPAPSNRSGEPVGETHPETESAGGGVGGGGGASARPVAVVLVDAHGVRVRPIVDVTKIALAALTAWGAMLPVLIRMRRGR